MMILAEKSNVVSFLAFKNNKKPSHHLPIPVAMVDIDGQLFPQPQNNDQYLKFVKKVFESRGMEDDYKEVLCAILDPEYYEANKSYYQTANAATEPEKVIPIYKIVDTFYTFPEP